MGEEQELEQPTESVENSQSKNVRSTGAYASFVIASLGTFTLICAFILGYHILTHSGDERMYFIIGTAVVAAVSLILYSLAIYYCRKGVPTCAVDPTPSLEDLEDGRVANRFWVFFRSRPLQKESSENISEHSPLIAETTVSEEREVSHAPSRSSDEGALNKASSQDVKSLSDLEVSQSELQRILQDGSAPTEPSATSKVSEVAAAISEIARESLTQVEKLKTSTTETSVELESSLELSAEINPGAMGERAIRHRNVSPTSDLEANLSSVDQTVKED